MNHIFIVWANECLAATTVTDQAYIIHSAIYLTLRVGITSILGDSGGHSYLMASANY